jgi:hypothetical protein
MRDRLVVAVETGAVRGHIATENLAFADSR